MGAGPRPVHNAKMLVLLRQEPVAQAPGRKLHIGIADLPVGRYIGLQPAPSRYPHGKKAVRPRRDCVSIEP